MLKSLEGIVKWVKWIELPKEYNGRPIKDITDLREHCQGEDFRDFLADLQDKARLIDKCVDINAYAMAELEQQSSPSLNHSVMCPSIWEIGCLDWASVRSAAATSWCIIAGTGQLKSAAAQNILARNPGMPALFCQLEISGPLMFERAAAIATGIDTVEVHDRYRQGERVDWRSGGKMTNLLVSTRSLTMKQVDELVSRSSAKLGMVPRVVVIDYIQLIRGEGTRYERVSEACEETKRLAKKWNLIAVVLSQISRKNRNDANTEEESREVNLYDGKESGSLENSCSVLLGIRKTSTTDMKCRVLKNTKGLAGNTVEMKIRGGTFIIESA